MNSTTGFGFLRGMGNIAEGDGRNGEAWIHNVQDKVSQNPGVS